MDHRGSQSPVALLLAAAALTVVGCSPSPLRPGSELELRNSVIQSIQRELAGAARHPEPRFTAPMPDDLPIEERFYDELNRMAGPNAEPPKREPFGEDLLGEPTQLEGVALEHAVRLAVANNLEVQFARFEPAIAEADVVAAQAQFDFVFGADTRYNRVDRPGLSTSSAFGSSSGDTQQERFENEFSLRKLLTGGGQFATRLEHDFVDDESNGRTFEPNPSNDVGISFQYDQPLLRNFGSRVALAQVYLNQNAERAAIADLNRVLNNRVHETEQTYWELWRSHWDLAIVQRLLERGEDVEEKLRIRREAGLEVSQAQLADAVSRVKQRRSQVRQAQNAVRRNSDRLKQFVNDPRVPVGSEIVLAPSDAPLEEPFEFSLLDAMTTAVLTRPEVDQAILGISDATIRQEVADNQRLPQLNLVAQMRLSGLDDGMGGYNQAFEGKYLDTLVGLVFEQPIGNRAAEADYRKRRLQRQQAVKSYRNTAQNIIREVKDALDNVYLQYQLVGQRRQARIAATESLRSLEVEQEQLEGLTAVQLDLRLNRQERLATAEREEIQALADYNIAMSELFRVTGTILPRNGIEMAVPNNNGDSWYQNRSMPNTEAAIETGTPYNDQVGYRSYGPAQGLRGGGTAPAPSTDAPPVAAQPTRTPDAPEPAPAEPVQQMTPIGD